MDQSSSYCVDLGATCKILARSPVVQASVRALVGEQNYPAALALMRAGSLEGDLGATLHDFLTDEIRNEATEVWSGVIRQQHDDYPITVNGFHGVYWVLAMEYDPVGYFLNKRNAISFARSNWENVSGR
jgi:hypothetical protein